MDDEYRRYGDATILEPIIEQQDDEMTTSPMSSSSVETTNLFEEERRAFEEIEQFEELEKECAMNRRGIRVKFDDERLPSMAQTTIVKSEPYFQINSIEDQVTKHFYHNEFPLKDLNDEQNHHSTDNSVRTLSELDSLEEKDQFVSSSPGRSILKKSMKKRQTSPSPHSDSNEMIHLAEVTGKQIHSQPPCPVRSLFEPTINIFDSSPSSNQSRRPSRLRYYIKPYRGDVYIPPERSRSLSEQRIAGPTVWYTFTNQYNRKNHVSWSPVRDYIHQGREKTSKQHQNKLSKQSSTSSPCLRTASSVTPVYSSQNSPASFTSLPQYEEKKQISSLPDLIHLPTSKKKHSETMQRYDRLLEKMKATDEQLQTLSRTWTTNLKQRTIISTSKMKNNKAWISPVILQMCLLVLVCFNLLVVFFFNEINLLWSQYISHQIPVEQQGDEPSNV